MAKLLVSGMPHQAFRIMVVASCMAILACSTAEPPLDRLSRVDPIDADVLNFESIVCNDVAVSKAALKQRRIVANAGSTIRLSGRIRAGSHDLSLLPINWMERPGEPSYTPPRGIPQNNLADVIAVIHNTNVAENDGICGFGVMEMRPLKDDRELYEFRTEPKHPTVRGEYALEFRLHDEQHAPRRGETRPFAGFCLWRGRLILE
jgi:hypothetical protein